MIHKEYDFKNLSYTNFIYNKREKLFVLCETGGELHIYNKNFDISMLKLNQEKEKENSYSFLNTNANKGNYSNVSNINTNTIIV